MDLWDRVQPGCCYDGSLRQVDSSMDGKGHWNLHHPAILDSMGRHRKALRSLRASRLVGPALPNCHGHLSHSRGNHASRLPPLVGIPLPGQVRLLTTGSEHRPWIFTVWGQR